MPMLNLYQNPNGIFAEIENTTLKFLWKHKELQPEQSWEKST